MFDNEECRETRIAVRQTPNHSTTPTENAPQVERPVNAGSSNPPTPVQRYTPTAHQRKAKKTMVTISFFVCC